MIFVTVGTHEQPFNRLIQKIDELKKDGVIQDEVIVQTGFSTYEPENCQWSKLFLYQQMIKNVAERGCDHSWRTCQFYHAVTNRENTDCCASPTSVR